MSWIPKKVFFVKGVGHHKEKIGAFEEALRDAGIEKFNLVKVSSILPPNCVEVDRNDGLQQLKPGQIVFCVLAREESNEYSCTIAASIGVAKPSNNGNYGYLSEYHTVGTKTEDSGEMAEDLASQMLATTLGVPFTNKNEGFKMDGKIVETKNITAYTSVKNENEWACVIAAAMFIL
jgi:arginine decarboxylase